MGQSIKLRLDIHEKAFSPFPSQGQGQILSDLGEDKGISLPVRLPHGLVVPTLHLRLRNPSGHRSTNMSTSFSPKIALFCNLGR